MTNRLYWATVGILIGLAFGFSFGGSGSPFATGESVTADNMNEIDAALDAIEAITGDADVTDLIDGTLTAAKIDSAITRDTEWDTEAEVQTAWGSLNILLETEIDASSELRALMDDESGTGALLFASGDVGAATATTASAEDNDTSVATTAYVQGEFGDLGAYTVGTSAPVDGTTACTNGDMYLDESANKIYFCVDSATDDWFGVALTDTP